MSVKWMSPMSFILELDEAAAAAAVAQALPLAGAHLHRASLTRQNGCDFPVFRGHQVGFRPLVRAGSRAPPSTALGLISRRARRRRRPGWRTLRSRLISGPADDTPA